jgi:hypothetical protein
MIKQTGKKKGKLQMAGKANINSQKDTDKIALGRQIQMESTLNLKSHPKSSAGKILTSCGKG